MAIIDAISANGASPKRSSSYIDRQPGLMGSYPEVVSIFTVKKSGMISLGIAAGVSTINGQAQAAPVPFQVWG